MHKRLSTVAALALAIAAAGCSGSDGSQGPQGVAGQNGQNGQNGQDGATGPQGPSGQDLTQPLVYDNNDVVVTSVAASLSGTDVLVTYNVSIRGVARDDFTRKASAVREHNEDAWWVYDVTSLAGARTKIPASGTTSANASWSIVSNGGGNYTATITGLPAEARVAGAKYMLSAMGPGYLTATVVAQYGAPARADVVSDQACKNCHGEHIWRGAAHDVTNPTGAGPCIVCHNRVGAADPVIAGTTVGANQPVALRGTGLMSIVHGVHNSAHMPSGQYVMHWTSTSATTSSGYVEFPFSVGFPTYMNNCSVCHDSAAKLAAVDKAFSYTLCMSCHENWDGFVKTKVGGARADHRAFARAEDCTVCHNPTLAKNRAAGRHNGLKTERAGVLWGGQDQSIVYGERFRLQITSIALDPAGSSTVAVKWTAQYDAAGNGTFAAVDPCNLDVSAGPVFLVTTANASNGQVAGNMSILRAYAQGDDWVANLSTASPGQPNSVNLVAYDSSPTKVNTTCAANVATTKIKKEDLSVLPFSPSKGLLALQGKPQVRFDPAVGTSVEVMQVRAKSPTLEYLLSASSFGKLPPEPSRRRQLVSVDKCNACHPGSLYQHGGNRVDSVELCTMCHNAASNEKNNRAAMGVTAGEAYDRKAGQTYDLRTMLHAIHSAGETGVPLVFYRGMGIYAFGTQAAIDALPSWKATQQIRCQNAVPDSHGVTDNITYLVFGSAPLPSDTVAVPTASGPGSNVTTDPTNVCSTIPAANLAATAFPVGVYKPFNEIPVHYPRALRECGACHVNDSQKRLPDPTVAVAVTDSDAGASTNATTLSWRNQLDDALRGPVEASCMTCHQGPTGAGGTWWGNWLANHAADNGWGGGATPGGRADFTNGVAGEMCATCHGEGRSGDVANAHR